MCARACIGELGQTWVRRNKAKIQKLIDSIQDKLYY